MGRVDFTNQLVECLDESLILHLHDMFEIWDLKGPHNTNIIVPEGEDAENIGVMVDLEC